MREGYVYPGAFKVRRVPIDRVSRSFGGASSGDARARRWGAPPWVPRRTASRTGTPRWGSCSCSGSPARTPRGTPRGAGHRAPPSRADGARPRAARGGRDLTRQLRARAGGAGRGAAGGARGRAREGGGWCAAGRRERAARRTGRGGSRARWVCGREGEPTEILNVPRRTATSRGAQLQVDPSRAMKLTPPGGDSTGALPVATRVLLASPPRRSPTSHTQAALVRPARGFVRPLAMPPKTRRGAAAPGFFQRHDNVYLYVPNLIGYARVVLAGVSLAHAFSDVRLSLVAYLLSFVCDELDGRFARKFDQCSEFGKLLDMVRARAPARGSTPPRRTAVACSMDAFDKPSGRDERTPLGLRLRRRVVAFRSPSARITPRSSAPPHLPPPLPPRAPPPRSPTAWPRPAF